MEISLERVGREQQSILWRLLQLYLHDMSEFTQENVDEEGVYPYFYFDEYWAPASGEERYPWFIRVDGALGGFAMVRVTEAGERQMCEFFVMRRFRRLGVGSVAARMIFESIPGEWWVHQLRENRGAQTFWPQVIETVTGGQFEAGEDAEGTWQRFRIEGI